MDLIKIIQLAWKSIMHSHHLTHKVNSHAFIMSETQHTFHRATFYEHLAITQKYNLQSKLTSPHELDQYQRNAIWFFLHAALKGYSTAQYKLGLVYFYGHLGLDPNEIKAKKWLTLAANQGHLDAQYQLDLLLKKMQ